MDLKSEMKEEKGLSSSVDTTIVRNYTPDLNIDFEYRKCKIEVIEIK